MGYKKHFLITAFVLMLILSVSACGKKNEQEGETTMKNDFRQISMAEATDLMVEETEYVIVDVRTQAEYEAGHIPGAICIPNESIGEGVIAELADKDALILVYCRSGNRSKQAAKKLAALGYTDIAEFGGIIDWEGETEK